MSIYPDNGLFGGIWEVSFYLAICAKLFETYRIWHRVGGLFVVLRYQILLLQIFRVHSICGSIIDMLWRPLGVDGLPHARQWVMVVRYDPGL